MQLHHIAERFFSGSLSMMFAHPGFSSAQAVPGWGGVGASFYLGICGTKTLPKMVPPGLSFGADVIEI